MAAQFDFDEGTIAARAEIVMARAKSSCRCRFRQGAETVVRRERRAPLGEARLSADSRYISRS